MDSDHDKRKLYRKLGRIPFSPHRKSVIYRSTISLILKMFSLFHDVSARLSPDDEKRCLSPRTRPSLSLRSSSEEEEPYFTRKSTCATLFRARLFIVRFSVWVRRRRRRAERDRAASSRNCQPGCAAPNDSTSFLLLFLLLFSFLFLSTFVEILFPPFRCFLISSGLLAHFFWATLPIR